MESKQHLAFGGMPTAPDVKRIRDQYPDNSLIEGQTEIACDLIAAIINEDVDGFRFRTVTSAWRRAVERESGKIIAMSNKVFHVLDDSGKLGSVDKNLRSAGRRIRTAKVHGGLIDRAKLTADEKQRLDFHNIRLSKLVEADRLAGKIKAPSLIEGAES